MRVLGGACGSGWASRSRKRLRGEGASEAVRLLAYGGGMAYGSGTMAAKNKRDRHAVFVRRRRKAARNAAAKKVDAMLVSRPEDVGYLTGFTGHDSCLLIGEGWECLLTDGRYGEQAETECGEIELHVRKGAMAAAIAEALKGRRVRRLGFQSAHVTVQTQQTLAGQLPKKRLRLLTDVVMPLRTIKDAEEIRTIRKAVRVAERAFKEVFADGADAWVGKTERDFAAELNYRMCRLGAEGPAFDTIVAAGAHGSRPHYRPGKTKIRGNAPLLIDWGAKVDGYCSDLTRVVLIGRIPPKLREIYEVVRRAQQAAIAAIRPGVSGQTVNRAAGRVVEQAGYRIPHGLGHGVGRQVHEAPGMGRKIKTRLRAGMVVTVEPGIYVPGLGGVRIEDDVLIRPGGSRRLSSLPRDIGAMAL